jgi:NAD(P)-dependent dehydrogenase (short-subunit alcohol dehydrogenase family)
VGDVCREEDCRALIRQTLDKFHRLDILVNNAGILEMGTIETTSLEQYDRIMNTNVRAVYHLIMLAAPHLVETRGNIVNVSSVNGIRSFPGVLAYNVSKAAVDQGEQSNVCNILQHVLPFIWVADPDPKPLPDPNTKKL